MAVQFRSDGAASSVQTAIVKKGLPILYEDDQEADLGESNPHVITDETLHICLLTHFVGRPRYRVFSNMNLYYDLHISPLPYVSPDTMIVTPLRRLRHTVRSYRIGRDGPAPLVTIEILSERSYEQRDLDEKVVLYAKLRVREYILVDVSGLFLQPKLVLKRLQRDGTWKDEWDTDGGVTSRLGFRLILDKAGRISVINAKTGKPYVIPHEAEQRVNAAEAAARRAQARIRELEAALARLRKSRSRKS